MNGRLNSCYFKLSSIRRNFLLWCVHFHLVKVDSVFRGSRLNNWRQPAFLLSKIETAPCSPHPSESLLFFGCCFIVDICFEMVTLLVDRRQVLDLRLHLTISQSLLVPVHLTGRSLVDFDGEWLVANRARETEGRLS